MQYYKVNKEDSNKACVVLTTIVYSIGIERNNRLHNNKEIDCLWRSIETECNINLLKPQKHSKKQSSYNTYDLYNYEERKKHPYKRISVLILWTFPKGKATSPTKVASLGL